MPTTTQLQLPRRLSFALLWSAVIVAGSGCTSLNLNPFARTKPLLKESANHPVVEVICLWEPAEGQGLDGLPSRGFAGQLLFFAHGHDEPVKVDGKVTLYVFDDQGSVEDQSRPLHEFNFEGAVWNTYLRESSMGAAYQLFIPYTRPGTKHAECSLRVKYTPPGGGRSSFSKMATIVLPGPKPEGTAARSSHRDHQIQQAAYVDGAVGADAAATAGPASASGIVQAQFESAQPIEQRRSLETYSGQLAPGKSTDLSRLQRLLRDVKPEDAASAQAADDVEPSRDLDEVPAADSSQPRRHRLSAVE
ncbi:MAG: hypothetical protein KDA58_09465 [Planctomycetaceae bacterium]|nr:hypothetical protein [Planctomycetaceae bacterium]